MHLLIRMELRLFFLIFAISTSAMSAPLCRNLFEPPPPKISQTPNETLHQQIASRYPELAFVTENPDRFQALIQSRFERAKNADPKNPYNFEFNEMGLPLLKNLNRELESAIEKQNQQIEAIQRNPLEISDFLKRFLEPKPAELEMSLQFLGKLKMEISAILQSNSVSYRSLIEVSYFYSRVANHFERRNLNLRSKILLAIDRAFNGHREPQLSREFQLYRERKFSVYQARAMGGFIAATRPFADAFANVKKLETIWVPTNVEVDRDIFMALMARNINLIGLTSKPILADGVTRPSSDFWNHDVRHESVKYFRRLKYIEKHGLNQEQIEAFQKLSERFWTELEPAIASVKDPNLREAIDLLVFNFHHDRGYPLMPSMALFEKPNKTALVYFLFAMMKASNQGVTFDRPFQNIRKADQWLIEFWTPRLALEDALIQGDLQN